MCCIRSNAARAGPVGASLRRESEGWASSFTPVTAYTGRLRCLKKGPADPAPSRLPLQWLLRQLVPDTVHAHTDRARHGRGGRYLRIEGHDALESHVGRDQLPGRAAQIAAGITERAQIGGGVC